MTNRRAERTILVVIRPLPARASTLACFLPLLVVLAAPRAQTPTVSAAGDTMRIRSATVTGTRSAVTIHAVVDDDNHDSSLPTSFRRWWHFQVTGIDPSVATALNVHIDNAGYTDVILPVWARSTDGGASFGAYERCPVSAVPSVSGSSHTFNLTVPAGVTDIRLAKWFPYPVSRRDALLASIAADPRVGSIRSLGLTALGRPIELVEITDPATPDTQKHRVWVHAAIHPSETPAAFMAEGLIDFLLSGTPTADVLLAHLIVDIVPLANPDGTDLGNYRTNSHSDNCEDKWAAPYYQTQAEVVALRSEIERLMGTAAQPGAHPIEVLLNLHSSHNVAYPFHFQHVSNASFDLVSSRVGVVPAVNQLEQQWIDALRAESAFVTRGSTQSSTLSAPARPFVESMMHDRWSIDPAWLAAGQSRVMAITLEGTYGRGPDGVQWNTDGDYLDLGTDIGRALGDYFGLLPGGVTTPFGGGCNGVQMIAQLGTTPDTLTLTTYGLAPGWTAITLLGTTQIAIPLPGAPSCFAWTDPAIVLARSVGALGIDQVMLPIPAAIGVLDVRTQTVALDLASQPAGWYASNGMHLLFVR